MIGAVAGVMIDRERKVQVTDVNLGADFDDTVLILDNQLGDFGETINTFLLSLANTIWNKEDKSWKLSTLIRTVAGVLIDGEGKVQVTDMNLGADFW